MKEVSGGGGSICTSGTSCVVFKDGQFGWGHCGTDCDCYPDSPDFPIGIGTCTPS